MSDRLGKDFFCRDVLEVCPDLIGKNIVRSFGGGRVERFTITEVEAYQGTADLACHASKGRTPRTEIMFHGGAHVYVYLIYGMYWMLNFVTGTEGEPQAALVRGVVGCYGPGRVGRLLQLDKSFYGEDLTTSSRLWVEPSDNIIPIIKTAPRIGVGYAGEYWSNLPWRFYAKNHP